MNGSRRQRAEGDGQNQSARRRAGVLVCVRGPGLAKSLTGLWCVFVGAPERRVFLAIDNRWNSDTGFQLLSDEDEAVFDAAVNWATLPFLFPQAIQNGNLNLSWVGSLGGTLQYRDTVKGPWIDIPDASSPHPVPLTGASRFFRINR